jgi:uncharacterized protein YndB with AHSA1/START domain
MSEQMEPKVRQVSVSRVIHTSPAAVFDVLADPAGHAIIDGSGQVTAARPSGPQRLSLGAKFRMDMKQGLPYRITNTVVEFEENRRIAWRHAGGHVWRYELEPVPAGTNVTETFDWSTSRAKWFIELMRYPTKHIPHMERTLERLDEHLTAPRSP